MAKEKIIIYLGNFNRPDNNAPGKRVYGNALILSQLSYKVILIGKENGIADQSFPIEYGHNIFYYSFPEKGYKTSEYINFVKRIIEKEGKPEIIIRYGSPGLALFDKALLRLCKNNNIKLITDVVDWLQSGGGNLVFSIVKGIDTYLEKSIYNKKSDGVIAISSYLSRYYASRGCKTIEIPPLVKQYSKNESNNKIVSIVYAGVPFRLGRQVKSSSEVKDRLDLSVEAISSISNNNVTLNIYGLTKEQYLEAYPNHKQLVERSSDRIVFHGRKSMIEVQEAVNYADFTILLREKNRATMAGFPTKVVESLSCGTPVITTDTSDLKKYITDGENGFFVNLADTKSLTEQMEKIISIDSAERLRLKENCYKWQSFVFEEHIESMQNFIDSVLEDREK